MRDVSEVFNTLTGYSNKRSYRALLVAPSGLRPGMRALIEREMEHAVAGRAAGIVIKNNAVADLATIRNHGHQNCPHPSVIALHMIDPPCRAAILWGRMQR